MQTLIVNVTGTSMLSRRAERAVVNISVSSTGPDQTQVTRDVTETSKYIQSSLRELSPKAESGLAAPGAPITHWSMSSLSTGSYYVWLSDKDQNGVQRKERSYSANIGFEIKFADFAKLGAACTDLANLPHVSIRNIDWRLTDATKASLVGQSRKLAVEDAVAKAKDFASAVGKTKVTAVEIDHESSSSYATMGFGGGAAVRGRAMLGESHAQEEELKFEPEEVELNCSVRVKFEA